MHRAANKQGCESTLKSALDHFDLLAAPEQTRVLLKLLIQVHLSIYNIRGLVE